MDWKETITSVSEHVFPGISQKDHGVSDIVGLISNWPMSKNIKVTGGGKNVLMSKKIGLSKLFEVVIKLPICNESTNVILGYNVIIGVYFSFYLKFPFCPIDREVLSNLPLQMALYFNVIFAPIWFAVIILFLIENYGSYGELYKFIIITIISTISVLEVLRLYLGYEGNLRDRIPELAGFWILSLLLQFPLQGFLLFNPYVGLYIVEVVAQGVMFIMLCIQLISGYCALKYTATQQTIYFRTKFGNGVNLANDK